MEYRRVGTSGLKVSAISLGAWLSYGQGNVEDDVAIQCIHKAIESGINFIDVANGYAGGEAEKVVGRAVKDHKRSDLVISTKAYWPMSDNVNDRGLSRKHLTESVHASLKRFNLEYIDLFFCHRFDENTPLEETIRVIEDLIHQGKILYWATSMWNAANINDGIAVTKAINANRPIVEQSEYNMIERTTVETGLETALANHGMGLMAFSPLAQGILSGKYNDSFPEDSRYNTISWFKRYVTPERLEKARAISQLAGEMGTTPAALAIAWTLKNPLLASSITGATKPSHVDENLKALDVTITEEINQRIEDILQNKPIIPRHN